MTVKPNSNTPNTLELVNKSLKARYRAEKRFKAYGIAAIMFGIACLVTLFTDIIGKGHSAFYQTYVYLEVEFDPQVLGLTDPTDTAQLMSADFQAIVKKAMLERFPNTEGRRIKRNLYGLMSYGAGYELRDILREDPRLLGTRAGYWLLADDDVDTYVKGRSDDPDAAIKGRLKGRQIDWVESLIAEGQIKSRFNDIFFTSGDSREPEQAGILGAIMGSLFTLLVTILLSFPIGVAAAVYLEEYAPKKSLD